MARFKKNYIAPILILSLVAVLLFAWLTFGRHGLIDLYKMQKEKERCLSIIKDLKEKNMLLADEIIRLRGDPKYLESVARKELGLVKENEIIYRFKSVQKAKKENDNTK